MDENTLLCRKCRNIFRIPSQNSCSISCSIIRRTSCPKCGSIEIEEAPTWAPLGSGSNIFDSSEWEYECQECHKKFKMPIPKSPTEEKERSCPSCGAKHIHSLTTAGGAPLYCG